jgi:predicted nuclease with TOPRIM domain
MREKLQKRLEELKTEFESGQRMLSQLETRQSDLKSTLLRISGAIQVLEELLNHKTEEEKLPSSPEEAKVQAV